MEAGVRARGATCAARQRRLAGEGARVHLSQPSWSSPKVTISVQAASGPSFGAAEDAGRRTATALAKGCFAGLAASEAHGSATELEPAATCSSSPGASRTHVERSQLGGNEWMCGPVHAHLVHAQPSYIPIPMYTPMPI